MSRTMFGQTLCTVLVFLLAVILVWLPVLPVLACGPFFRGAIFSYSRHPDFPLESFAAGNLGILQPTYARSYLVVAYRHLAGVGLDADEQEAVVDLWRERLGMDEKENDREGQRPRTDDSWFAARKMVPAVPKSSPLEPTRNFTAYQSFLNCTAGAFANAGATLQARIKEFGAGNPALQEWVRAQDAVFSNCSGPALATGDDISQPSIPEPAPASFPALLRADRAYQIASANFYAGRFDAAQSQFSAITADAGSPWKTMASYLVARALVRKATLSVTKEGSFDGAVMRQAEASINKILGDPALRDLHPAAKRLMSFVAIRLHPAGRREDLAAALLQKGSSATIRQNLWDYTVELGTAGGEDATQSPLKPVDSSEQKKEAGNTPGPLPVLTDWIQSFQDGAPEATQHSIEQWQATGSLAWLVAALTKAGPTAPQLPALLAATEKVETSSPAFAMAKYHRARLLAASGKADAARAALDALLRERSKQMPASALNLFLALRMRLVRSLDEFLTFAPRVPATVSLDIEGRELPDEYSRLAGQRETRPNPPLFDPEASQMLTERLPLEMLKVAARSSVLPGNLHRQVVLAAWVRAVMLEDGATAEGLVPVVKEVEPALKAPLDGYLAKKDPEARKFAAIFTMLKFPGLRPFIAAGAARETSFEKIDNYRDNWWCSFAPAAKEPPEYNYYAMGLTSDGRQGSSVPDKSVPEPAFPDAAAQTKAKEQWRRLVALPAAPSYLTAQVIAFATKFPQDPRVPEALHLAVRTTRYGCTGAETKKFSRQAFELLHKNYPNSAWTKKTPHWY